MCTWRKLFSYLQWAEILGWSRGRTMRFFKRMFACERLVHLDDGLPRISASPIMMSGYPRAAKKGTGIRHTSDNGFKAFWEQYHEITRKDKVNPGKARKVWNKLSAGERIAALENIETYYYHLNNTLFCLQAVNYLSHKAFLNEYEYEY